MARTTGSRRLSVPDGEDGSPIACLLPNFDEYMIGYKDRSAMFPAAYSGKLAPRGNIAFNYTIIINGIAVGGWRKERKNDGVVIRTRLFRPLDDDEKDALICGCRAVWRISGDACFAVLNWNESHKRRNFHLGSQSHGTG